MKIERNNSKKTYFKKTIAGFFVFMFLFLSAPQKTQAAWIPGVDPAIRTALELLKETTETIVVDILRTAAIAMLNSKINNFIGGDGGFIKNWKGYIVIKPKNTASVYLNDYLSQATRGRGNSSSYSSEGYNYNAALYQGAKNNVSASVSVSQNTYEGNPKNMFQNGRLKNLDTYLSGANNPWSFNMAAKSAYENKVAEEKEVAKTKSIAYQGFEGASSGETVTRPGSLTKDLISNIENIPNTTLATADKPMQVVAALINSTITAAFRKGFESILSSSEVIVENAISSEISSSASGSNPGDRFD